jgi:4-carboxymuconolactone decarboxylase
LPLHTRRLAMVQKSTIGQTNYGDIAPGFADLTDRVLNDDLWNRHDLSPRDRSLVTISSLVALYRHNELGVHVKKGLANGLKKEEIVGAVTHLAFYAGWPVANTAIPILRKAFEEAEK